jgi:hypothetical protein
MGATLPKGGPAGGLFIGFLAYGTIVMAVNECFGESRSCQETYSACLMNHDGVSVFFVRGLWLIQRNGAAEMVCYIPLLRPS